MANNDKENKIEKFTKEAIGKTLNQFNKEIGVADLVEINKNQDRILNGILSQVNDESTEKTEKSNIITLDNSTDGIVELKEIQGDTNVNVSKIEEDMPITHDIGEKEGNVFTLNEIPKGAISIGEIQGNTMVNCNKDDEKELVLMKDLSTQEDNNITLTEGVDGGKVDVALEGNTMVNVCDQKDPVAITKSYTVETGNHVALQGEYDGKCRPVVTGNTLVSWCDLKTYNIPKKGEQSTINGAHQIKSINTLSTTVGDKVYFRIKFTVDELNTSSESVNIFTRFPGGYSSPFKLFKDCIVGNIEEASTIREHGQVQSSQSNMVLSIGMFAPIPEDVSEGGIICKYTVHDYVCYNLTQLFGKGNEPQQEWCDKNLPYLEGLQSSFEDKVVTQEMVDNGEELAENLGKYKVDYKVTGKNKFDVNKLIEACSSKSTINITTNNNNSFTLQSTSPYVSNILVDFGLDMSKQYSIKYDNLNNAFVVTQVENGFNFYVNPKYDGTIVNLQIEEGTESTSYEPYKEYKKTFYLNSPLLEGDTIEQQGDNVVHVHRSELRAYETDDELTLPTDMTNTLVAKATPQYEVISQNDSILCDSYANGYLDVDSVVPIEKVEFMETPRMTLKYLYPSTDYTIQFEADNVGSASIVVGGKNIGIKTVTRGINKFNVTTNKTPNNQLKIGGVGFNASNIVVTEATDQDFGYFEGMKSVGECEDLEVVSCNSDGTLFNSQTLTHEPLRAVGNIKDKYVLIDGKWYIERNCGVRAYQEGDIDNYITDMINTVYPLQTPQYEPIDYSPFTVYSDITHITNNSTIPCNMTIKNTGYNCLLKPSTTYTVSSNLGLSTVTTPSVLTEDCLRFYDTDTSSVTTMNNVMVLEGDYTTGKPLPSHFSGIESAFEQEYDEEKGKYRVKAKVVGKNLFDGELELGTISSETGLNVAYQRELRSKNYIRIPCLPFTISISLNTRGYIGLRYYDKNYKYLGSSNGVQHGSVIGVSPHIPPIGTYYIRFKYISTDLSMKFQIEQGTQATPYEPYKENYIEFYINEPLRGVGDVKDRVYVKDNKVVVERNCGSVTFDGSDDEDWIFRSMVSTIHTIGFGMYNIYNTTRGRNSYCNNFVYDYPDAIWNIDKEGHVLNDFIHFRIHRCKLQTQDVAGFKQWLRQNPTTVVYQLEEPVYEEVEYSSNRLILNTFNNESFNNSTLFLDTNISPKLSFKPLYEELVYVKNSTKYYIQFNAVGSGEVVINLGGTELTTEIVEGYNCIPITTPSESTNLMTIIGQGITISEVVVSEVICGGYYKGLQSCFEEHMENGKYRVLLRGIALDGSKVNGIKLYINEPLRGIGNTKDRLCIKNGKLMVERKYGEAIFDGSDDEIWDILLFNFVNHTKATTKNIPNLKGTDNYRLANSYCDKFIQLEESPNFGNDTQEYYAIGTSVIEISINNSKLSSPNVNGIKKWLQQNPTKITYELKNPVYEEVTNEYGLPIVFEGYENGIVYIDSAITPTTHIKYTSNNVLATTLSEAEEQNNSTQDDINVNVVTYMMDIDMLLTEMEMSNDISVMAVRRDSSNENMLDRMSDEDKKVYQDNTVVMLEKMITANVLDKEDIEGRIDMYYNKNRISKEQYKYLKSLL